MADEKLDTNQKALRINSDARRYGTFAEIGAGQEVARCRRRCRHGRKNYLGLRYGGQ